MADTPNTLTQALLPFIDKAQQGLDKGIPFLSEQIPDIIQQLLLWKGITSFLVWFLGGILPLICLTLIDYKVYKWAMKPIKEGWTYTNAEVHDTTIVSTVISSIVLYTICGCLVG